MDNQITERARGVDVRVQQALDSGAYAIDADDVRELLAALRYSNHVVARVFDCQTMELKTQVQAVKVKEHAQGLEAKLAASNTMVIQLDQQQVAGLAAGECSAAQEDYEAWCRVKSLAESGTTPQIDARDVLRALVFCERENKELLEKKTSAGRAYQNHIAWLEDQLAKARASTGGSRELAAAAISIRDRLADYFRYVAEGLPFERQTESNERAQALINGLGLLANDLEAGRLADQCTRLHRNQLQGELDEARAALDASQGQVKQLEAELRVRSDAQAAFKVLADRQADLLSRTAIAIRGPEPELTRWGHHDLPLLAAAMRQQRDICAGAVSNVQWSLPDMSGMECVCPECQEYEHDGHKDDCQVGRACGIYDVLRLTGALPGEKSLSDEAARQADGAWLPWPGGDMPEEAAGKLIDIEQRDGEIFQSLPAESFRWDHLEMDGDVVFWRVSNKARVGCPECGRQPGGSSACATCAALQMTGVLK